MLVAVAVHGQPVMVAAAAPVSASHGRASRAGWQLVHAVRGIRIYRRGVVGSGIPEAQARMVIDAPPAKAYAVISDYDRFAEFLPYVEQSRTIESAPGVRWVYQRLHFPGPVADRQHVIRTSDSRPRQGVYRIEWRLAERKFGVLSEPGDIVPAAYSGSWELWPHRGGRATLAVYTVHLDLGGLLPKRLISWATNEFLPDVIMAMVNRIVPGTYPAEEPEPEFELR